MSDDTTKEIASTLALQFDVIDLENRLERIGDGIAALQSKQVEMAEGIAKIKEAVYNPEQGIYARLRELENWKKTHIKLMWLMTSSVVGLLTAAIFNSLVS